MDVERIIDEIEQLQETFEAPDIRPLSASDISAANRRHDTLQASLRILADRAVFGVWASNREHSVSSPARRAKLIKNGLADHYQKYI
jgi:hypothetical protein